MANFFQCYPDSPHTFWLNVEVIEQVDVESQSVWTVSGEEYRLDDVNFRRLMESVVFCHKV